MRCAWGKFNELMPILPNNERDLLKGEGEDLQSLCAECVMMYGSEDPGPNEG